MDNYFSKDNIGFETSRNGDYLFLTKNISDGNLISNNSFNFPLYLYPKVKKIKELTPFDRQIFQEIAYYQKNISSLSLTQTFIKEIDKLRM
jgi:hypothetical protein